MTVLCLRGHQMWAGWAPLSEELCGPDAGPVKTAMWCECAFATSFAPSGGEEPTNTTDRLSSAPGGRLTVGLSVLVGAVVSAAGIGSDGREFWARRLDCVMQPAGRRYETSGGIP